MECATKRLQRFGIVCEHVKKPTSILARRRQRESLDWLTSSLAHLDSMTAIDATNDAYDSTVIEIGEMPYHVGSSLKSKRWRDVDVRLILSDEAWDAYGFCDPARILSDGRWVALCLAFSALGKEMTGLPIDFQIQKMSDANDRYDELRSAIGRVSLRYDADSRR